MARAIEDVLHDYATPFIAVWGRSAALDTAAIIWDLVIDGLTADEIVHHLDEEPDAHLAKLVAAFVQRKQTLFPMDRRYVVGPRVARPVVASPAAYGGGGNDGQTSASRAAS